MSKNSSLRHSIDASFFNGITDIIIKTLTSGPLLTAYAVGMGVSNMTLGFLQSVLPFSNLLHLLVSGLLEKGISPKKIACISSIIARPFLLLAGLSVFFQGTTFGFILFLLSYCLSYITASITGGAFWPWCKELVPQKLTSSFFAKRTQFIILTRMLTVGAATGVISLVQKYHEAWIMNCYGGFFIFAFLLGLFYIYTLFQMADVQLSIKPDIPFLKKIRIAFSSCSFLGLISTIGFINFSLSFFGPFSLVFLMKGLGLSTSIAMLFSMASNVTDILFLNAWNRYTKKSGINKTLSYAAGVYILAILSFVVIALFKISDAIILGGILTLATACIGAGNAGLNLGINDVSISYVPNYMSSVYISLLNIGKFACSGMGAVCAGFTLELLNIILHLKWSIFFMITAGLFILAYYLAKRIRHVEQPF